jgi:rhodanese-related sulfurtransferase
MHIKNIKPADAARAAEAGELQLVDIRLAPDAAADHIALAANIPFPELEGRIGELDRGRPVAFLCRAGAKSQEAAQMATGCGLDALNVEGGALAWREQVGGAA